MDKKRVYDYDEFSQYCNNKTCLRNTFYNPNTCVKDSKQKRCYDKWLKKQDKKIEKDERWEKTREKVWIRDFGRFIPKGKTELWRLACRLWNCLTHEEKRQFLLENKDNLYLCKHIDVAHIESKTSNLSKKYEEDNCMLLNRLSHKYIDSYKNPITGKSISKEERLEWFNRMKSKN